MTPFDGAEHREATPPLFTEHLFVAFDAACELCGRQFVGFGKDDAERNDLPAEHFDKAQVDLLGLQSGIDQHEQEVHPFASEYVVGDDFGELVALGFRCAGVTVTGQIDQIPTVVDAEMVDKPRLARGAGNFGQAAATCEHIDQRRLADVAAADEGELRERVFRQLRKTLGAAYELCLVDLHDKR